MKLVGVQSFYPQKSFILHDNTDTRIIMTREYFVKFNCDFDLLMYPFDTQVCNMQLQECFMTSS